MIKMIMLIAVAIFIPWICMMMIADFIWAGDFSWNPYDWTPQGRGSYLVGQIAFSWFFGLFVYLIYKEMVK